MTARSWLVVLAGLLAAPVSSQAQQVTTIVSDVRAGQGFSGYFSAPISNTAVLHSWMDATDTAATLGFAVAIRGPAGWYNARTKFGEIPKDSLPAGAFGQWWQVGERHYRFVYDPAQKTLVLFDTTLDLSRSRVVLVTLGSELTSRPTVVLGQPVAVEMTEPVPFQNLFLPKAPEVRAFAGVGTP